VRYDDLPLKTKSGLSIDVEFISTVYESDGIKVIQCMIRDISARKRADRAILAQLGQIRQGMMSAVELVTAIAEMRDPYTAGHEKRVAAIAAAIGAHLGFDADRIEGLRVAGYLHDIGKMSIPSEILSKPGKLSVLEMRMVQAHVQAGYDSLSKMAWPWPVAEVALQHHERLDGSGYPNGLSGEAILIEARIMAVADVFEAMSGHRPYRASLGVDRALAEIEQGRGRLYDSDVVDACLHLYRDKAFVPPV
jgi:putative nucleotidyltransferase with HDIG domain